jgi:hypothetical protein
MPRNTSCLEAIATIGIDIGKNTFHLVALIGMVRSFCARSFHAAKSRLGSRTCRPASSAWRRASEHIISATQPTAPPQSQA